MGHGKETPRQKMIGMMYLVLTALLALNVSKDVLNAFVIVDEGISKTVENFAEKNEVLYNEFERAAIENPKKAEKWKETAFEVKKKAEDLNKRIHDLKVEIINLADGPENLAIKDNKIDPMAVNSKDNTDKPAQIMVGEANNGQGKELKKQIDEFREYCLSLLDTKAVDLKESIESSLDTHDPEAHDGVMHTWESEHFEHLPLIAVTTVMTGLQANVRNAETDILRYLYSRIDAGAFKFNKLEAVVIHNSDYIIVGNEYKAQVFIAAQDTTQQPSIYIGSYDSTVNKEDGSVSYTMRRPYDSLKVEGGKGIYTKRPGSAGQTKWGGLIRLKAPEGGVDLWKPFRAQFSSAAAALVVSPVKMNVLYIGVDNPVEISVPGVPGEKIFPTLSNGKIRKEGDAYIINVTKGPTAEISVMAEIDKQKRSMGSKLFRVKTVPDPVAKVNGLKGGAIDKNVMLAMAGVSADMENFDFDLVFKVTAFNVTAIQSGFARIEPSKSNKFTPQQLSLIKAAQKNQKVYIEDIKAIGPDGTTRSLGTLSFTLK